MASVNSITRQIAALELASKKGSSASTNTNTTSTSTSTHPKLYKQSSSQNVAKLLTKYAAPNPFTNASNKPAQSSSLRYPASTTTATGSSTTTTTAARHGQVPAQPPIDIGRYDGGLEL